MGIFDRTAALLGDDAVKKLNSVHIAVFGLGGVGSYSFEALVRSGIGSFTLVDGDTVCETNINRQLVADSSTVGMNKTDVACRHGLLVNPQVKIEKKNIFFNKDTSDLFDFSSFDYVIDAIDSIPDKVLLIKSAYTAGIPVISCMGAGNKLDPLRFEVADIYDTSVCPLARIMRRELKKEGVDRLRVVYSREPPLKCKSGENSRPVTGSVSFVPSAAGLILAGEVIKDILQIS